MDEFNQGWIVAFDGGFHDDFSDAMAFQFFLLEADAAGLQPRLAGDLREFGDDCRIARGSREKMLFKKAVAIFSDLRQRRFDFLAAFDVGPEKLGLQFQAVALASLRFGAFAASLPNEDTECDVGRKQQG